MTMAEPSVSLERRRIVVTGAGRGIGRAIAEVLVSAGARVIVNDLDESLALDAAREIGAVTGLGADVSDPAQGPALLDRSAEALGGLDGLVNNAGIMEEIRGTRRQTVEDWQRVLDVNLRSVFLMSQAASTRLSGGGAIVSTASVAGLRAMPASNAYSVSKAGIVMMTQSMACDLARFGIRVNAVAPGVIEAPMARGMLDQVKFDMSAYERRTPMGRLGRPNEIGHAVLFLLSDLASYITGVTLPVDGGWTAFGGAGNASV